MVPTYNAAGLITGAKCWQGAVVTTAGGLWSADMTKAGFTSPPNVQIQAVSSSNALTGLLIATMTAPTATTVSGAVVLAGIGGLGCAGVAVMVRAVGT